MEMNKKILFTIAILMTIAAILSVGICLLMFRSKNSSEPLMIFKTLVTGFSIFVTIFIWTMYFREFSCDAIPTFV